MRTKLRFSWSARTVRSPPKAVTLEKATGHEDNAGSKRRTAIISNTSSHGSLCSTKFDLTSVLSAFRTVLSIFTIPCLNPCSRGSRPLRALPHYCNIEFVNNEKRVNKRTYDQIPYFRASLAATSGVNEFYPNFSILSLRISFIHKLSN